MANFREGRTLSIGDVQYVLKAANRPALVPRAYAESFLKSREALEVWMQSSPFEKRI